MTNNTITSCQANQLLALQRDLMGSGLEVTVGECTTSCTTTPAPRATRKTAAATTPRRGRPPKTSKTVTTPSVKTRKMSKAGKKAISGASSAYHAKIKELRATEDLTQKQARVRYQEMKTLGTL